MCAHPVCYATDPLPDQQLAEPAYPSRRTQGARPHRHSLFHSAFRSPLWTTQDSTPRTQSLDLPGEVGGSLPQCQSATSGLSSHIIKGSSLRLDSAQQTARRPPRRLPSRPHTALSWCPELARGLALLSHCLSLKSPPHPRGSQASEAISWMCLQTPSG